MSRVSDFDVCKSEHLEWQRKELRFPTKVENITEERKRLVEAVNSSADGSSLASFLDGKFSVERLVTSGLTVLELPEGLEWEKLRTSEGRKLVSDAWRTIDEVPASWLAVEPVYWAAVHYQAIASGRVSGDIRSYFAVEEAKDMLDASNTAINLLGSAPYRWGYPSPVTICFLGRVWWELQTAKKVASVPECPLLEYDVWNILQTLPIVYAKVTNMSVASLTTLNSSKFLASVIYTAHLEAKNSALKSPEKTLAWLARVGRTFYPLIPDYMEWDDIVKEVRKCLHYKNNSI